VSGAGGGAGQPAAGVILVESPPEVGAAQCEAALVDQPGPVGTPGFAPEDVPSEQRPAEAPTRSADPPTIPGNLQIVALPSRGSGRRGYMVEGEVRNQRRS